MRVLSAAILLLAAGAAHDQAFAQTPSAVSDLVGARAAGGETQLEARGYSHITTNTVRDTKWSIWWSERQRQCISVATADGRYTVIQGVPAANCSAPASDTGGRPPQESAGRGETISLVCIGSGSGPAAQSNSGYRYNSKTKKFEYEMGTTLGRDAFSSDLEIEIANGLGRVHPSGNLVSPIHSGGVQGWWPIEDLMVTPDRITGQYRMNGMNKPRIDYDRRARIVHIREATDFTGRCEER
ncbi:MULTISPECIES: hypothetical protein [unclassified Novosphingobium]|uniref:hypothetical protein n=1 Tax=unclassified Novosphingobium TaxID=2644732 RepID=UPI0013592096|nr:MULTISPECIES: hypothetical protein [unclassified Novosphingobium]